MRAWLFNTLAGASALLFVATMGLWVSSYWYRYSIGYAQSPDNNWVSRTYGIDVVVGAILAGWTSYQRPTPPPPDYMLGLGWILGCYSRQELEMPNWTEGLWFEFDIYRTSDSTTPMLEVPCWALALLSLILPLIWTRRRRNLRRQKIESVPNGPPQPDDVEE
jgi:hypothetical protein